jgi:hypothetical protein
MHFLYKFEHKVHCCIFLGSLYLQIRFWFCETLCQVYTSALKTRALKLNSNLSQKFYVVTNIMFSRDIFVWRINLQVENFLMLCIYYCKILKQNPDIAPNTPAVICLKTDDANSAVIFRVTSSQRTLCHDTSRHVM